MLCMPCTLPEHPLTPATGKRRSRISPTSPTFDVSTCAATERPLFFPLHRHLVQTGGELQTEALEQDLLVVARLGHAARAQIAAVLRGQDHVDGAEFA